MRDVALEKAYSRNGLISHQWLRDQEESGKSETEFHHGLTSQPRRN
jgi:hypothetical protein